MLIYHCHSSKFNNAKSDSNIGFKGFRFKFDFKKKKNTKKGYKRKQHRKSASYSRKSVGGEKSKKPKVLRKKQISKKNVQFLEGLGLKVKQKH